MSEIEYLVKLTAAPGRRDDALAVLAGLVDAAEGEDGTLHYRMYADASGADTIWFYEAYADRAAFEAHIGSAAMAEVGAALGGLLAGAPEMHPVELVKRKGGA